MYRLLLLPRARKTLLRLPREYQERIGAAIDALRIDPFIGKKLEGKLRSAWTFRVWPYRIIYTIDRKIVTVTVLRIGHRQGIYKT